MTIESLEAAKDEAENEMEALRKRLAEATEGCRAVVLKLQCHIAYTGPNAERICMDSIGEALADFVWEARTEIENRKTAAENTLSAAEQSALQKSAVR